MRILKWLFGSSRSPKLPKNFRERLDSDSVEIVRALQRAGHETYLVGGCVRDLLLEQVPKDFDIATSATPQQVKSLVKRAFVIGRRFRIVVAKRRAPYSPSKGLFPLLNPNLEKEIQITTFRRDPVEVNGVVNENVFGTAEQDAFRRDFTINALFLDPTKGSVVDFVGGSNDLKQRFVRVIGDPVARFEEDPIRIFRALRFKARGHLKLPPETETALRKAVPALKTAKRERIREEILKILREGTLTEISADMERFGMWPVISPQLHHWLQDDSLEYRKYLKAMGLALKAEKWPDPKDAAPLFTLLLYPIRHKGGNKSRQIEHLIEELKVSRAEREDMERIEMLLERVLKDPEAKEAGRILTKNSRHARGNVQTFFVLQALAASGHAKAAHAWKSWKAHWVSYAKGLEAPPSQGGSKPLSSSRRRSRRGGRPSRSSSPSTPTTPSGAGSGSGSGS